MSKKESKITQIIKGLDKNGSSIGLRLKGSTVNQSLIGAILSILSLIGSLALSFPTFLNYINFTNPKISVGTEFTQSQKSNTTNAAINFSDSSLYVSMSFYNPVSDNPTYMFNDNNYSFVEYINQLNITCTTCPPNNQQTTMNLCNKDEFEKIELKSMSKVKSTSIMGIFKNFSFCFPNYLSGTIKDFETMDLLSIGMSTNSLSNETLTLLKNGTNLDSINIDMNNLKNFTNSSDMSMAMNIDSTLTIFIPFSKKKLSDSGVQTNSISRATTDTIKITTSGNIDSPPSINPYLNPVLNPSQTPPNNQQTNSQSPPFQQPSNGTNGQNPNTQNPTGSQPMPSNSQPTGTQPLQSTQNPTSSQFLPTSNQQPMTQGGQTNQSPSSSTNLQQSGTPSSSQQTPTNTQSPPTNTQPSPTNTQTSTNTQSSPTNTQTSTNTQSSPTNTQTSTNTQPSTTTTQAQPTQTSTTQTAPTTQAGSITTNTQPQSSSSTTQTNNSPPPPGKRILLNRNYISSRKNSRNLQTSSPFGTNIQQLDYDQDMINKLNKFRFPKIMFINRDFQINPNARINYDEPLYQNVFNLDILDYRDILTGNPKSYNIFVQESKIEITIPQYLWSKTESKTILKVLRIEENSINSNINQGAIFSFKTVSEMPKITITFTLFSDWLSVFGSFSTVFALVNNILCSFFSDSILDTDIVNSLFKFIDNNEEEFKKEISNNGPKKFLESVKSEKEKKKKSTKEKKHLKFSKNIDDLNLEKEEILKFYELDFNKTYNIKSEKNDLNKSNPKNIQKKNIKDFEILNHFNKNADIELQNFQSNQALLKESNSNTAPIYESLKNLNDFESKKISKEIEEKIISNFHRSSMDLMKKQSENIEKSMNYDGIILKAQSSLNPNKLNQIKMENICFINKPTQDKNQNELQDKENNDNKEALFENLNEKRVMLEINNNGEKTNNQKDNLDSNTFRKNKLYEEKLFLIEKVNRIKNRAKNKFYLERGTSWCYASCGCFKNCMNKNKVYVDIKTKKIIRKNMEISQIIKKNFELEFLKKIILTNKEMNLFPFQFKYLNIGNMALTKKFLKTINNKDFRKNSDNDIYDYDDPKSNPNGNNNMVLNKLVDDFKNYYNF